VSEVYTVYVISFLVFIAMVVLVEGVYLLWRGVHEEGVLKINRRLKMLSAGGAHGQEVLQELLRTKSFSDLPWLNRILMKVPRLHALDRTLEQAAVRISVGRFLLLQVGLAILITAILLWTGKLHIVICTIIGITLGFVIPTLYVYGKRDKRRKDFARQLPEALDFIARSMRAGNPFSASLKSVAKEMPDPIGTEFGITFDEMNYGLELDDALHNLGNRTGSDEMHFFITAVLIQRTTGGNLADVLNKIAAVMRARARTVREIMILSAEMRLSARVLIALPFVVAGALTLLNPGYLTVLFKSPVGQVIIGIQLLLMLFGYLVIRRMVNFRI
jgi:tight adherence protein B